MLERQDHAVYSVKVLSIVRHNPSQLDCTRRLCKLFYMRGNMRGLLIKILH